MQIRTRIFIFVGGFFLSTMIVVSFIRILEMKRSLMAAKNQVEKGIEEINVEKKDRILNFLVSSVVSEEVQIEALFSSIKKNERLKQRYTPGKINYQDNDWDNANLLMRTYPWIDFIQTTDQKKLTSRIESMPPFLKEFKRIVVHENLNIIIENNYTESSIAYIGVPYWSNQDIQKSFYEKGDSLNNPDKNYWLLFTIDQILSMDPSQLKGNFKGQIDLDPSEPVIALTIKNTKELLQTTIFSIDVTKKELLKHPELIEILQSPQMITKWMQEKGIEFSWQKKTLVESCKSYLCSLFKNKIDLTGGELIDQYEQKLFIGQLTILAGTGVWKFDPLQNSAPKGIVSFPRNEILSPLGDSNQGSGVFGKDSLFDNPIAINYDCAIDQNVDFTDTCISKDLNVYVTENLKSIYLINTLIFSNPKEDIEGTLSIGIDIMPIFKKISLISNCALFFLTEEKKVLYINSDGIFENLSEWNQNDLEDLLKKETGVIRNKKGEEYLFFHLISLVEGGGTLYIVELKDSGLKMEERLNQEASFLSHEITIQQLIITAVSAILILLIQDRIIRKIVNPLRKLSLGISQVSAAQYGEILIPEEGRDAKDEIGVLLRAFIQMIEDLKKGEQVRGILDKVVSKKIAEKIIREGVKLGGEIREVTILFSDIRSFTAITQNMDPQDVLDMLNDCLTILTKAVDDFEGVIDKYVGDEVMALFGAPVETKQSALRAVQCAKSMREVMREWNRQRKESGLVCLQIGIGIHTGRVIAGNVGAESHPSYTVLGHNVNLASRLCSQAEGMEILITKEVLESPQVRENIEVEALAPLTVKGITEPIKAYRVL
jgi:class 3 adenylate cyclase